MDRLDAMTTLLAVVETGSFVRGAEKLGISTTSISRLVAELEEHLGTRLLQRTTRRLHLTYAGRRFVERATQLLGDLDEVEAEVGAATTAPKGRLRISVPLTFGVRHLAELFPLCHGEPRPLPLSRQAQGLLDDLDRHRQSLRERGIWFGSSRLAVRAADPGHVSCAACGLATCWSVARSLA